MTRRQDGYQHADLRQDLVLELLAPLFPAIILVVIVGPSPVDRRHGLNDDDQDRGVPQDRAKQLIPHTDSVEEQQLEVQILDRANRVITLRLQPADDLGAGRQNEHYRSHPVKKTHHQVHYAP